MADIAATVELKKAQAKEAEAEADKKNGVETKRPHQKQIQP